jgi:hypothetical protein
MILMALCAVLCGADTWVDVAEWAEDNEAWLKRYLRLEHGTPSHDTFGRLFRLLDAKVFEACFREWISDLAGVVAGVVAIDGKTACGSRDGHNTALHTVSAYATASGLCLGQEHTRGKGHEIPAIKALLDTLALKGCIVTIDAIGCQTEIARKILDRGGDYLLAVKDNQKDLADALREFFADGEIRGFGSLPAMRFLEALEAADRQGAKAADLSVSEEFPQGVRQVFLVVLDGQQVITAPVENLPGNLGLTADGVDRDDAALEGQCVEQRFDRRNLVALAAGVFLPQAQAAGRGIRTDRVQCRVVPIPGAAGRLAINRDHAGHNPGEVADPFTETGFEHLGVQQAKQPTKRVVRRCAVLKAKIAFEPRFVVLRPFGNIDPGVRPAQHRA